MTGGDPAGPSQRAVELAGGDAIRAGGMPGRVILVDYAAERHRLLGQLVQTIAGLLRGVLGRSPSILWWGQSFGCLLTALVSQRVSGPHQRIALVSPFTGLPAARVGAARLALAFAPKVAYATTAGVIGPALFGPDPDHTGRPFFGALAAMPPLTVRRRLGWLAGRDYASAFLALRDPLAVWLGEADGLIDLPRQLAFFTALARRPGDRLTVLGGCGHVVLPTRSTSIVATGLRSWVS